MCRELVENHKLRGYFIYTQTQQKTEEGKKLEISLAQQQQQQPTLNIGSRVANTQIIFFAKKTKQTQFVRVHTLKQIQLHTEICVNNTQITYKIEKCSCDCVCEVLQIFFFYFIYLFCFIVHFIPFGKVAVLMACVLYTIDRRFVIIIAITVIIPYLTFSITLFKVCFDAHRSVDGFANVAAFFSLIRSHSFHFALDAAHCLFRIRILFPLIFASFW